MAQLLSVVRPYKSPKRILRLASRQALAEVLVVGYDRDGDFVCTSSSMNRKDALWLLEHAKKHVMEAKNGA